MEVNIVPLAVDWLQLRKNLYHESNVICIAPTIVRVLMIAKHVFNGKESQEYLKEVFVQIILKDTKLNRVGHLVE